MCVCVKVVQPITLRKYFNLKRHHFQSNQKREEEGKREGEAALVIY